MERGDRKNFFKVRGGKNYTTKEGKRKRKLEPAQITFKEINP